MSISDQPSPVILRVAVIAPLDHYLDYLPAVAGAIPAQGSRVRVRLKRQLCIGIVATHATQPGTAPEKLRTIEEIIDTTPIFPEHLLQLLQWTAQYYHYPIGKVLRKALPRLLRAGHVPDTRTARVWHARSAAADKSFLKRAKKQRELFEFLRCQPADEETLNVQFAGWRPILRALIRKDLVYGTELHKRARSIAPQAERHVLNDEQAAAVQKISASFGKFSCHLLEGITGSGKTEVYLQLTRQVIAAGGQVVVMVPEISLASQTVRQFHDRFGAVTAVLHSGLSDGQRFRSWWQSMLGEVQVIIGTRSVVFTSCADLRLIVVDEEHDLSYKQQDTLRYHARDLAIKRAQLLGVPIVLGSATPSLESLHNMLKNRYQHHRLSRRIGGAILPQYQVVDIRGQPLSAGLSPRLVELTRNCIKRNEQVLLFLNRRGYAPRLLCHDCGTVIECPRCGLPMTYHLSGNELRCHRCECRKPCPDSCPNCQKHSLKTAGFGTERIERELRRIFPETAIVRIDTDTTRRRGAMEKHLAAVRSGNAKILIGTQMISKGHHFPDVTLIGIINVDQRLFAFDFRALERLGQLIVQVSGRAGRERLPGLVVLQTYHPDNANLQCLIRHSYHEFAKGLLVQRRQSRMPPYRYLALFCAEAKDASAAQRFLGKVATVIRRQQVPELEMFGPVLAPTERKDGLYRVQLMLSARQRTVLNRCIAGGMPEILQLPKGSKIAWYADIDPMELE